MNALKSGINPFASIIANGSPSCWGASNSKAFYDGYAFYATDYLYQGQGWTMKFDSSQALVIAQNVGLNYFGKSLPPNTYQVIFE
jgi:hypothetical protein